MAAATMNNLHLTRGFESLQATVNDFAARLAATVPQMEQNIADSASGLQAMYTSIRSDIQPVIDNYSAIATEVGDLTSNAAMEKQKVEQSGVNTNDKFNTMQHDHQAKLELHQQADHYDQKFAYQ